ncbi:2,5-diamino-6-(ribosylamino)-4(3H)-pyrimidinone 5'-phosphate reductase [Mycoemilia scoparia]|uniref:2,5-diamino-6-ribosylamino-4(3H)-pyrimidinone 5'-phosphate reductase n=1 Tax=Mycoemilia scoparia TaxID=417184 RepID=A0A9W8A370_9FUNG|nr:2,5-diamino-6-(ribosylamino)-4(3H)-pyrimidinone 5'-phosphate reductase [Mycoemilia scoparia]
MCDNAQNAQEDSLARPYVTLTYAQSLDGKLGVEGYQLLLSGSESYGMTHRLRSNHDGILVGINTVINDNPRLTARLKVCEKAHQLPSYENPQPIVLDSKLRIPLDRRLLNPEIPKYGEGIPSPKLPWLIALQGQYDMAKRQASTRKNGCKGDRNLEGTYFAHYWETKSGAYFANIAPAQHQKADGGRRN